MNEELLDSLLSSLADITDELWTIRWNHFLSHLGYELPIYLRRYCPAPEQMLYQLVSALDLKYQRYFGPSKLDKWRMQPRILQPVAHPQFHLNPGERIKQTLKPTGPLPKPFFPPKWSLRYIA